MIAVTTATGANSIDARMAMMPATSDSSQPARLKIHPRQG
jgi:hypothetical protein